MSDLFHSSVPDDYIAKVIDVMRVADWHQYQVLTKRADRLQELLSRDSFRQPIQKHVWWGVSVEDRKYGLPRIDLLRDTPAEVRFLSVEPLLEDLARIDLTGIHWVIVGGESGPGAREMKREWVLSIRDQCLATGVPFFFKQWGGVRKSEAGRELDKKFYDEMPVSDSGTAPPLAKRRMLLKMIET
jgi:protein gp37